MSIVIFSKSLKKTDIEVRLTVPTNVLEHINMPEGDNYVYPKDSDGKRWERIKQSILVCFGYGDRHLPKVSKKTDMPGARLTVPTHAEGENHVDLSAKDSEGKEWPIRYYIRPDGHPKPAFTTGWLDFVRAKGLQIGDKVTFSKLQEDEAEAGRVPQYRIRATRTITLFGKQFENDL